MKLKPQVEPIVHSSLGLNALCERLQAADRSAILELGPVRGRNIEFWSRFSDSIYVADLPSSLPLTSLEEGQDFPGPEWDQLLGVPVGQLFDVILAWDVLNYLELSTVSSLIRYLSNFCRPGTILFALIFDHRQMPDEITVYRIVDEGHLVYELSGSAMRTCPRHQPRLLTRIICPFRTSSSFRLRNGVVEYLFAYEGDKRGE